MTPFEVCATALFISAIKNGLIPIKEYLAVAIGPLALSKKKQGFCWILKNASNGSIYGISIANGKILPFSACFKKFFLEGKQIINFQAKASSS
jgi:hypothetical protein